MKLTQAAKTFESNAEFTSQDFTIGDTSVVIEILRNKLYRHKVRTLVQEYISNARDAMREINSTERVQITLPTMYAPTFKVRDFGPGISQDRMYNVFIKYASSTKRKDNVQTGGFGIGAKSAWSYTESFSIVTFIDGIQRTYVAHIGANNNGRLDFLGETPTEEKNGTEIQIPVSPKDVREFKTSAFRAVYFWNESEQPVFVNLPAGEQEKYVQGDMHDNLEVNNNIPDFIASTYDSGIIIAIDGIPYMAGSSLIDKVNSLTSLARTVTGRLVLHLNNGDLEVSASREEIADSKHTTDSLTAIGTKALKVINTMLAKEFAKAKTPFEHLTVFMGLKDSYKLDAFRKCGSFTVNDKNSIESDLFQHVKLERCEMPSPKFVLEKGNLNKTGRRSWHRRATLQAAWFDKLYFCDGTETSLISNYRIKALLANGGTVIVFTKQANDAGQFDTLKKDLGLKDLKSVAYTKPDRKAREVIKIERTQKEFCIHRMDRFSRAAIYASLEKNTQKWLYVERTDTLNKPELMELNDYVESRGYKICSLGQDAIRRVKGDANFKPLADWLKTFKVSKEDVLALKMEAANNSNMMLKLSKLSGIKNKFLNRMIEEYKTLSGPQTSIPKEIKTLIGKHVDVELFKTDDAALSKVLKADFGLLEYISWPSQKELLAEVVSYINIK